MGKAVAIFFINQEAIQMNAVGIDVSKGKSTVLIPRPLGDVISLLFDVTHNFGSRVRLADLSIRLVGASKDLMEVPGPCTPISGQEAH